jgi:DNA-binding NarL/FixJ family response regulator
MFLQLEGDLEVAALGPSRSQLSMNALYRPPLALVGRALDRALLAPRGRGHDQGLHGTRRRADRGAPSGRGVSATMAAVAEKVLPLRVMLVDDHEVVRSGVRALLQETEDIIVTAEAGTVREAVDEAVRARPDVVVMDVRLADGSGIEATREIRARHPNTRVVMLTSFADDEALFASIMAGASGYVLKQVRGGELVRAIRTVGKGESLLDPAVTNAVLDRLRKGKRLLEDEKLARLSPQEERILGLVADGKTNREIGDELDLAEKTVKNYVSSILSKLEVARRAEAAAYLARHTTTPGTPA